MIVKIHSENPDFLSILMKNKNSFNGLQLRDLKNGVAIGRVISDSEYHMVFQDTKYSFSDQDFSSQIDYQSYCNPKVFLSMASIFLRHLISQKSEMDKKISWLGKSFAEADQSYPVTVTIPNVYADGINPKRKFVLAEYFSELSFTHKSGHLYEFTIQTDSIHRAVNLACITLMYLATINKQPWYLTEDLIRKYIRIVNNIAPVPYFLAYLLARRCLLSKEMFDNIRPDLQNAVNGEINLVWGNTQVMRLEAVERYFGENNNVLEIGCGEFDYVKKLGKKIPGTWYASDLEDYSNLADSVKRLRNVNLEFCKSLLEVEPTSDALMLAVEVIEHMPEASAMNLLIKHIKYHHPKKIIVTTPNREFNQYYAINGFRHDDHHFEFTQAEFKDFMNQVTFEFQEYKLEYFGIGDCVNGDYVSLGCYLER